MHANRSWSRKDRRNVTSTGGLHHRSSVYPKKEPPAGGPGMADVVLRLDGHKWIILIELTVPWEEPQRERSVWNTLTALGMASKERKTAGRRLGEAAESLLLALVPAGGDELDPRGRWVEDGRHCCPAVCRMLWLRAETANEIFSWWNATVKNREETSCERKSCLVSFCLIRPKRGSFKGSGCR